MEKITRELLKVSGIYCIELSPLVINSVKQNTKYENYKHCRVVE